MCIRDRKNVEPDLSVEDGEAVQMEETELEPPTLEMERLCKSCLLYTSL